MRTTTTGQPWECRTSREHLQRSVPRQGQRPGSIPATPSPPSPARARLVVCGGGRERMDGLGWHVRSQPQSLGRPRTGILEGGRLRTPPDSRPAHSGDSEHTRHRGYTTPPTTPPLGPASRTVPADARQRRRRTAQEIARAVGASMHRQEEAARTPSPSESTQLSSACRASAEACSSGSASSSKHLVAQRARGGRGMLGTGACAARTPQIHPRDAPGHGARGRNEAGDFLVPTSHVGCQTRGLCDQTRGPDAP